MKKKLTLLPLLLLVVILFNGCKKGEGDPLISFRSRKARVVGEWTVSAAEGTRKEISTSASSTVTITKTTTWTFDGTTKSQSITFEGAAGSPPALNSSDKFTLAYEFYKEGKFKKTHIDNNSVVPVTTFTEGVWNFTDGIGSAKKKASLILQSTSIVSSTGGMVSYTGTQAPLVTFEIYQLKNKQIVLKSSYKTVSGITSDELSEKFTLIPLKK
jgi:hypothetical protein